MITLALLLLKTGFAGKPHRDGERIDLAWSGSSLGSKTTHRLPRKAFLLD
jgi:hypothetical protein